MKWKRVYALLMVLLLLVVACCRSFAATAKTFSAGGEDPSATQPVATDDPADAQSLDVDIVEPTPALPVEAPVAGLSLPCKAALLMSSDTGEVLYEMHADEELAMASITKVMTLLLTFEALDAGAIHLEDIVPVSEHAFSMGGSQIWLEPGEQLTLHEMIKAICVSSANDAAVAVAEYVGGSEPLFVERMNARAAELGMTHTCFKNACGLDEEGHYSTARDIAVMSMALMQHPQVFEYTQIWTDSLRDGQTLLTNTNKLLRSYNGITGLKTGTTSRAGVCISATATRDGMGLIAVILGSPSGKERFEAASSLLDYGFANYHRLAFPAVDGVPEALKVKGGCQGSVGIVCQVPDSLLLKKGEGQELRCELSLQPQLEAPVSQGQQVGQVLLFNGATQLAAYPVVTTGAVEKMQFSLALDILKQGLFLL